MDIMMIQLENTVVNSEQKAAILEIGSWFKARVEGFLKGLF